MCGKHLAVVVVLLTAMACDCSPRVMKDSDQGYGEECTTHNRPCYLSMWCTWCSPGLICDEGVCLCPKADMTYDSTFKKCENAFGQGRGYGEGCSLDRPVCDHTFGCQWRPCSNGLICDRGVCLCPKADMTYDSTIKKCKDAFGQGRGYGEQCSDGLCDDTAMCPWLPCSNGLICDRGLCLCPALNMVYDVTIKKCTKAIGQGRGYGEQCNVKEVCKPDLICDRGFCQCPTQDMLYDYIHEKCIKTNDCLNAKDYMACKDLKDGNYPVCSHDCAAGMYVTCRNGKYRGRVCDIGWYMESDRWIKARLVYDPAIYRCEYKSSYCPRRLDLLSYG